jgi:hypothetical protein
MWVEKTSVHPLFSVNARYDLKWFSPPNIIRTMVPAVTAALKKHSSSIQAHQKTCAYSQPFNSADMPKFHF